MWQPETLSFMKMLSSLQWNWNMQSSLSVTDGFNISKNEIIFQKICSESAVVDNKKKDKLEEQTEGYEPQDIFNVDETGLFYKYLPNKVWWKNKKLRLIV